MSLIEELEKQRNELHSKIYELKKVETFKLWQSQDYKVGDYFINYVNDEIEEIQIYKITKIDFQRCSLQAILLTLARCYDYEHFYKLQVRDVYQIEGMKITYAQKEEILNEWFEHSGLGDF